ncbi:MAG: SAM-dependent methyltransferase [Ignavibacteria bacterium]|nr:SAM-dependent methyltransferase [Ignavibacteria bacterium]
MNHHEVIEEFLGYVSNAVNGSDFIKLTFGKYRGKDELEQIFIMPVKMNGKLAYRCTHRYKTKDIHKNIKPEDIKTIANRELGKNFLSATLFTPRYDLVMEFSKRRIPRVYKKKPSLSQEKIQKHNRIKKRNISPDSVYLRLLGITSSSGEIKPDKYDKFRQIDKFIEILSSLYKTSPLTRKEKISVADFGSGKSYLTFAVYDFFRNSLNIEISLTGIEQREDLVKLCNEIAVQCNFNKLNFLNGSILDHDTYEKYDIVISLHACDTATDDAIVKALQKEAKIIILAPCCHKYVRKKITMPDNLNPLLRHGIIREHFSAFLTDTLRALVLESYGYKTKIFEFISHEHTSKNLMITAVAGKTENKKALKEIQNLRLMFGLEDFYLDKILKI